MGEYPSCSPFSEQKIHPWAVRLTCCPYGRFHQFFNHIDNYKQPHFLYLTSKGIAAAKVERGTDGRMDRAKFEEESDNEDAGHGDQ